jgi:opacity protein-like surface antigen
MVIDINGGKAMKRIIICLIFCTLLSSIALAEGACFADEPERKCSTSFGMYLSSANNDVKNFSGEAITIDAQYFFNDYVGAGLYFFFDTLSGDVVLAGAERSYDVETLSIGLSLIFRIPAENFDLYALAGIGYGRSNYTITQTLSDIGNVERRYVEQQTEQSTHYRFEAGLRYYAAEHLALGLSAGYALSNAGVDHTKGTAFEGIDDSLDSLYLGITMAVVF